MSKFPNYNYKFQITTEEMRQINRMKGRQVEVKVEGNTKTEKGELLGIYFYGDNLYLVLETKDSNENLGRRYIPTSSVKDVRPID